MSKEMHEDGDDDHIVEERFIERFNDLRRYEKYSDCSFKVEGHAINCHKLILTAASPVFEAMFYGPLAETRMVKIDDISYNTFSKMLDFIYTGRMTDKSSIAELMGLYYCAQKYIIEGLGKAVLKNLTENTRTNNVLTILKMAYDMTLDDILYSCILTIKQWMMDDDYNFGNHILQKSTHQLPPKLVSFLVHETFEFKNYNSILCFMRAWCLIECSLRNLEPTRDNFRAILHDCDLPKAVNDVFLYQDYAFGSGNGNKKYMAFLQRTYYKATRPLVVGNDTMETTATFWADQFTTVAGFSINSRLVTSNQKIEPNSKYTEELFVELWTSEDHAPIISKKHTIRNVEYNESAHINLTTPIILFPGVHYTLKLKWGMEAVECEYPRSIFSNEAKQKGILVNFLQFFQEGSILNGLICEI